MALSPSEHDWYINQIEQLDPNHDVVSINRTDNIISYSADIYSDETLQRSNSPEEYVHALAICLLKAKYQYPIALMAHEKHYEHGRKGTNSDEVDLLISDADKLPFAMWEFKSAEKYQSDQEEDIKRQLFGTVPLVGVPKLLVHATIKPQGELVEMTLVCIDYSKHKTYEGWVEAGRPHTTTFPVDYRELNYEPFQKGGKRDLKRDCTQADFRAVAATLHNELFSEHPDNTLFSNLVKCLLAKIYDERRGKKSEAYKFQVFLRNGKEESALEVFDRINEELYKPAYQRYIDPEAKVSDEISSRELSPDRVKTVVKLMQDMSITQGAALHGDVIGAFFEEILRDGFKQDRGMYFTHDNLASFMVEAVNLPELTLKAWEKSTHPDNRLPYVIDPACESGTFLIKAMNSISNTVQANKSELISDQEGEQFYRLKMSDGIPNGWAESFLYGLDPKFIMAITAKVNMVLHGDGSAHIYKQDAFKPLESFSDSRFRPMGDGLRSVPKTRYNHQMCETFDLVISNPPFGITLSSDTSIKVDATFALGRAVPSEALFLERCFQLLKPNGRLAVVIPESLLNASDNLQARLLLYRFFWVRAIVSLPRNIFVDTPTLTSLLFAQKKTSDEIKAWDDAWEAASETANTKRKTAQEFLTNALRMPDQTVEQIQEGVLRCLFPMVTENTWMLKSGINAAVLTFQVPVGLDAKNTIYYYRNMMKLAGFGTLLQHWIFSQVVSKIDSDYPVFVVDEVGYKLSKRKERSRQNQLMLFRGIASKTEKPNLHLSNEEVEVIIDRNNPQRVLDFLRTQVVWR